MVEAVECRSNLLQPARLPGHTTTGNRYRAGMRGLISEETNAEAAGAAAAIDTDREELVEARLRFNHYGWEDKETWSELRISSGGGRAVVGQGGQGEKVFGGEREIPEEKKGTRGQVRGGMEGNRGTENEAR